MSRPLHEERDRLVAERDAAKRRVGELEVEERRARRALAAARAGLEDYLRDCEADGITPDSVEVERLEAPARSVAHRMATETVTSSDPETGTPRVVGTDHYDPIVRAQLDGARTRVERAEGALAAFEREHWDGLLRELAPDARERVDEFVRAVGAFVDAQSRLHAIAHEVAGLGRRTGAFAVSEVQGSPVSPEVANDLAAVAVRVERDPGALLPFPRSLVEALR